MRLTPAHLSLLHEAAEYGQAKASTEYEHGLIAELVVHGYLTSSDRITAKGTKALNDAER